MKITCVLNGKQQTLETHPRETLFHLLRRYGIYSIKFGSEDGTDGYSTVLLNGKPRNAIITLAGQADGAEILTVEGISGHQRPGWNQKEAWHPLQHAFIETGAIQSGYDTPALILAAKALLDHNPNPTEIEIRDAISGILSRETGYVKPVLAIMRAAAYLRGEDPGPLEGGPGNEMFKIPDGLLPRKSATGSGNSEPLELGGGGNTQTRVKVQPKVFVTAEAEKLTVVGKPLPKVDAPKLAQGKPAFVADFERPGMLYAKILHSPHAHARITAIDMQQAEALPGVRAVLCYKNVPRVVYSTAGQSYPIPGPQDYVSFDNKVRYVGDRVAAVAADTPEIATQALELIQVTYEVLPPVLNLDAAMAEGAPIIHDQEDYIPFGESNPTQNLVAKVTIDIGDVDTACENADRVFETQVETQKMKHVPLEPWVCMTYWDEDDRLVIMTSTQVPYHVRRILAPVLGLSEGQIRVIKPRIGAAFGNKQEIYEDIPAHLTIATGRPVLLELTREEQFIYTVTRHPMRVKFRVGVNNDGTLVAQDMRAWSDTGAYGGHGLTVLGNTGHKTLPLYNTPNVRFWGETYYTTRPRAGAYRGYGVTQGVIATETLITEVAAALEIDPLTFRLKNIVAPHTENIMSKAWSEGREARGEMIETNALHEAATQGAAAIGWYDKFGNPDWHTVPGRPHLRRGIGIAFLMQGSGIPNLDMAAASIKMNDDGSFNLMIGATDLGTGSDTVLSQIAAEVLGCTLDALIVRSSDTDITPFDKGAYASSTTYISGGAVARAAEDVAHQIKAVASEMSGIPADEITLYDNHAWLVPIPTDPEMRDSQFIMRHSLSFRDIALYSLHQQDQHQIMGHASFRSPVSPPPFAAQFAEVTVDIETGQVTADRLLIALDSGQIVNPLTASGQAEGGMLQALGYGLTEELIYDDLGRTLNPRLDDYRVFRADESPTMETIFVETFEPSHPLGVKSVSEIVVNGVAPAILNAIYNATGVMMKEVPVTPERLWRALQNRGYDI
ncbi:MAG: molybdopterin-dependent oxidoreductase [Anaerolineae bacterium]|nr:molybdopterin-dependent oxidoreductase [Anaerolineae bacterium]